MSADKRICSDRVHSRITLEADCGACKGLCCVLLPFDADQGFAFNKAAGTPCPNLTRHFRCSVHTTLVERGFPGCRSYDCHGAGQYVTALLNLDDRWHEAASTVQEAYEAFTTIKALHMRLKARRARRAAG
jgi:hypothetical protein